MTKLDKPLRVILGLFWNVFGFNGLMQIFAGAGFIPILCRHLQN